MGEMDAREALRYVAGRDVLILVGVIILGIVMNAVGTRGMVPWYGSGTGPMIVSIFWTAVFVAGAVLQLGGLLALLYKIVSDAVSDAGN